MLQVWQRSKPLLADDLQRGGWVRVPRACPVTVGLGQVIPAFYVRRQDARRPPRKLLEASVLVLPVPLSLSFTLLFSHGNAEDLGLIIRCRENQKRKDSNGAMPMNIPPAGTFES